MENDWDLQENPKAKKMPGCARRGEVVTLSSRSVGLRRVPTDNTAPIRIYMPKL